MVFCYWLFVIKLHNSGRTPWGANRLTLSDNLTLKRVGGRMEIRITFAGIAVVVCLGLIDTLARYSASSQYKTLIFWVSFCSVFLLRPGFSSGGLLMCGWQWRIVPGSSIFSFPLTVSQRKCWRPKPSSARQLRRRSSSSNVVDWVAGMKTSRPTTITSRMRLRPRGSRWSDVRYWDGAEVDWGTFGVREAFLQGIGRRQPPVRVGFFDDDDPNTTPRTKNRARGVYFIFFNLFYLVCSQQELCLETLLVFVR